MRVERMLAEFDASALDLNATQVTHARDAWRPSDTFIGELTQRMAQNSYNLLGQVALTEVNQV